MNHRDELPLAKVSEVDEAKRQWLQGMRHPVDTVTEPEPAEILAEFIRQHSAAGQLVARTVFLSPPYSVAEEGTVSFAGKHQAERRLRGYRVYDGKPG